MPQPSQPSLSEHDRHPDHRVFRRGSGRYDVLLIWVVLALLLSPFAGIITLRPFVVVIYGGAFLFALWTSGVWSVLAIASLSAAVLIVILSVLAVITSNADSRFLVAVSQALFSLATLTILVSQLLRHHRFSNQLLAGALTIYLLFGVVFSQIYYLMGLVQDNGFFAEPGAYNHVSYLYFSFITLTTVGYGDLTPGADTGRALAMLEALLGQIYLVTVVAFIVSARRRERAKD